MKNREFNLILAMLIGIICLLSKLSDINPLIMLSAVYIMAILLDVIDYVFLKIKEQNATKEKTN